MPLRLRLPERRLKKKNPSDADPKPEEKPHDLVKENGMRKMGER
jgi:hypothetical protein